MADAPLKFEHASLRGAQFTDVDGRKLNGVLVSELILAYGRGGRP
jgi:hypothetical protein